jgi:hypothetical protein
MPAKVLVVSVNGARGSGAPLSLFGSGPTEVVALDVASARESPACTLARAGLYPGPPRKLTTAGACAQPPSSTVMTPV